MRWFKKKEIRLCKDCKYMTLNSPRDYNWATCIITLNSPRDYNWATCISPDVTRSKPSEVALFVTGEGEVMVKFCTDQRRSGECGKYAKYFEPKEASIKEARNDTMRKMLMP
jgi:hypothetical protein